MQNSIPTLLNAIKTNKDDSFLIKSGVVHAIGAGHLILEVQQNSDTTYRVYDWNRNGSMVNRGRYIEMNP